MKISRPIFCCLTFAVLFCIGCSRKPAETLPHQPGTDEITVSPGVSFDEETVIEPMFPLEESKEPEEKSSTEDATSALPTPPNRKFTEDASVKLPKVGDLVPQIDVYVKKLEKTLDDLDGSPRFVDDAEALHRDANTLALIALALGLSKEENPYKKAAPAMIEAALKLETVKNLDDATKAVAEIKQSLKAEADSALSWDKKIASLGPIMKAVPNVNTLVKRNLRTEAVLKKGARTVVEGSAVIAVIGQGSVPNAAETIKPDAVKEWTGHCLELRDAALALNKAASDYETDKGNFEAVQDAYEALSDSCDSCHKLFYKGEVPKD
ncbi:MAG: hypothetical protein FWC43_00915 [Planctomycetaceae bacterium]|nr:hypothetical protein [Planctomycetaceae bacterium]